MKSRFVRAITILLSLVMVSSMFALSASAESYKLDVPEGKEDVLTGMYGYFISANSDLAVGDAKLTDGVYAADSGSKVYINKSHCGKGAQGDLEANFAYKLTDNSEVKYYYTFRYDLLDAEGFTADVDSFAMYFNNENVYCAGSEKGEEFPQYHIDAAFDILVSQDGGETYTIAWKSNDLLYDGNGTLVSCAGMLVENGGNCSQEVILDAGGNALTTYKYIIEDFDKTYEGVTNILYGCREMRRDNTDLSLPFYYVVRCSEFDVYGKKNVVETEAPTGDPTDAPPEIPTAAPTEAHTDAPTEAPTAAPTEAPANTNAPETKPAEEKKGCSSTVAMMSVIAVMGMGVTVIRKKH